MTSPWHLAIKENGKRELMVTLIAYVHVCMTLLTCNWLIREGRNRVHAEALISGVSASARQMASMIMRAAAGKRSLESRETWLSTDLSCLLKQNIILRIEDGQKGFMKLECTREEIHKYDLTMMSSLHG
jgi:hypothetical protein